MSKSMTYVPEYTDDSPLPKWASEWERNGDGTPATPIRPIIGDKVRIEDGVHGRPVIYASYAFVSSAGTIEPADARELAEALIEAADIIDDATRVEGAWAPSALDFRVASVLAGRLESTGVSVEDMAGRLGMESAEVQRWLSAEVGVTVADIDRFATCLGVDLLDVFGEIQQ